MPSTKDTKLSGRTNENNIIEIDSKTEEADLS